jgi:bacillithiol system protein YtxJ
MSGIRDLRTAEELDEVLSLPRALLIKKSPACGISRRACIELDTFLAETDCKVPVFCIDVLAFRNLSRTLADKTGISHESPQAFYLENGKVVWNASHFDITADALRGAVLK